MTAGRRVLLLYAQRLVYKRPFEYLGHLGIHTVAAHIATHGYEPRVATAITTDALALCRREAETGALLAVGLTCDYDNETAVASLCRWLRRELPAVRVVVGGPHTVHLGADFLRTAGCDAMVRGDGEEALLELLDHFSTGRGTLAGIPGLAFLDPTGSLVLTPERPLIKDLDRFPSPTAGLLLNPVRYNLPVVSTRGCPYRCAFCYEGGNTKTLRRRGVKQVVAEIRRGLEDHPDVRYVWFVDDTFTIDPARTLALCEELARLRREHDFVWFCEGHPGFLARSPDLVSAMCEAGLARMQIGLEAGWDEALQLYGKQASLADVLTTFTAGWQAGLPHLAGNFIVGGVRESPATLACTKAFALDLVRSFPSMPDISTTFIVPLPNTAISRNPPAFGLRLLDAGSQTSLEDFPVNETEALRLPDICQARQDLLRALIATMREQFRNGLVPFERVRRQFELALRYGVASTWYRLVGTQDPMARDYFTRLVTTPARRLEDVPPGEREGWFPCRVSEEAGRVDWTGHRPRLGGVEISAAELDGLALCSGHRAWHEIRRELSRRCAGRRAGGMPASRFERMMTTFAARRWVVFYPP
jgi:anaerobic magnesium-protoporphyrin IX monomethyl ester cyclase